MCRLKRAEKASHQQGDRASNNDCWAADRGLVVRFFAAAPSLTVAASASAGCQEKKKMMLLCLCLGRLLLQPTGRNGDEAWLRISLAQGQSVSNFPAFSTSD